MMMVSGSCQQQQSGGGEWRWLEWWLQLEVTHPSFLQLQAGGPPTIMHPDDEDQDPSDVCDD